MIPPSRKRQNTVTRVLKYGTGDIVPDDAIYLETVVQTKQPIVRNGRQVSKESCWLVWHYFLVEEEVE